LIVLLQRGQNGAGRQIELRQPAAVVLYLLNEFESGLAMSQNSSGRSCSDRGQRDALLRLKPQSAQAIEKPPLDLARMGFNQNGKTL
jgi:hypothetical protein